MSPSPPNATSIAANKLLIPQTGTLAVAPQPTGGQGLALNSRGKIPLKVRKKLPGYLIGYDQITSPVTVTSVTEATGTVVIAGSSHPFDGEDVWVEVYFPEVSPAAAAAAAVLISLFEGSTQIGRLGNTVDPAATSMVVPFFHKVKLTPTAGYHTYSVTAFQSGGNGTVVAGAGGVGAFMPGSIRFLKA